MVPPALAEMRQNMLPRKLNKLIEDLLGMENVEVSDNKGGQEPIAEVHQVIMVKVRPNVGSGELTIIIISVVTLGHFLVQRRIEVAEESAAVRRPMIKHDNHKAKVDQ